MKVLFQFILWEIIHSTTFNSMAQKANGDDGCPADWTFYPTNGRCYFISNQFARFDVATRKCDSMSSSLSSILSLEEQIFLLRLIDKDKDRSENSNYWLGLRNISSYKNGSSWSWTDGSLFTNRLASWGENFPSGKYDCGFLSAVGIQRTQGHWEDEHCDKPMKYICKKVAVGNALAKQLASTFSLMKEVYMKAASGQLTPIAIDCPRGWFTVPPFISCYYLGKDDVKYSIADESCKSRSSSLAKFYSIAELKSIADWIALERNTCLFYEMCSQFWIGLRFSNASGKQFPSWTWSDGSFNLPVDLLKMTSFVLESPSEKFQQCVTLHIGDTNEPAHAVVSNCGDSFRYICRKDIVCPDGFFPDPRANSCYRLITEVMNWTDASKMCQNISPGVHLATILSRAENSAIMDLFETEIYNNPSVCRSAHTGHSPNAWIGAHRTQENCSAPFVWKPSDAVQIPLGFTNWFSRQPSCDQVRDHCVHITQIWSYTWNDNPCEDKKCSICQKRFPEIT